MGGWICGSEERPADRGHLACLIDRLALMPGADDEALDVRYSSLAALIADLRGMAATNLLVERPRRPFGRLGYAAATAAFAAAAEPDGRTTERFHILHLSGWAPSPDQPKPARRGSATASLAEALKPKD